MKLRRRIEERLAVARQLKVKGIAKRAARAGYIKACEQVLEDEVARKVLDCVEPLGQVQQVRLNGQYRWVGKCPFCGLRLLSGPMPWKELDGTLHNCKGFDPLAPKRP